MRASMARMQKQVVVIAAPSGGGKNTIINEVVKRCSNCSRLVTATTRAPRQGEINGTDYHFLSEEQFLKDLKEGNILEHRFIENLGTHYGVYKPDLDARIARGETVLCHLDIIGARYLKEHFGATTIFVRPESMDELMRRIQERNPDMRQEERDERMRIAKLEMEQHAPEYDYQVINADGKLDAAVDEVIEILKKEGYTLES